MLTLCLHYFVHTNSVRSSQAADGILNNPLLLWLLKALPIYPVWGQPASSAAAAGTSVSSLLVPDIRIAPSSMNPNFLDNTFLKVQHSISTHYVGASRTLRAVCLQAALALLCC
jgi:hypothetical protein